MNVRRNFEGLARRGFTMIELIVVILIILILAALLLPAVRSALGTANVVKQVDDMGKITAGLEAFKAKYGVYPPSRIRLREGTAYNMNEGFDAHSVKMLRALWRNLPLVTVNGAAGDPNTPNLPTNQRVLWCADVPGKALDPNNWTGVYELEGDECLVFFLGGIPEFDRSQVRPTIILHGFTKGTNPTGIPNANTPATMAREDKLVEFDAGRLVVRQGEDQIEPPPSGAIPATTATSPTVGHAFSNAAQTRYINTNAAAALKLPSYLALGPSDRDAQRPYAYFSAYAGVGYRPDDCNLPSSDAFAWFEPADPNTYPTTAAQQRFQLKYIAPRTSGGSTNYVNSVSAFPNPYTESFPYGPPDAGSTLTAGSAARWYRADGYQVISPGSDGRYGPGGQIPRVTVGTDAPPDAMFSDLGNSGASFDNVTNVAGSQRLGEFNQSQASKK
jgi:prepilin-type N-terminal cleavage/methylation domain-containing protein